MTDLEFSLAELRAKAIELGFDDIGITSALIPEEDKRAYETWIANGYAGDMTYMQNNMRCNPQSLLENAVSAIIFVSSYKQPSETYPEESGMIASYARGKDYHNVHRKRLKKFIAWMEEKSGQTNIAKGFSDSAPLLEKALAVKAGLGWFGKNTLLIHRRFGTFTLLSGLLTTLTLPFTDSSLEIRLPRCGSCTRCLDACPTGAFANPYELDATKCLSYHLIESKKEIPEEIRKKNPGYLFGCDICQNVCPHNVRPKPSKTEEFQPSAGMGHYLDINMINEIMKHPESLYGTSLQRKKASGIFANYLSLNFVRGNKLVRGNKND